MFTENMYKVLFEAKFTYDLSILSLMERKYPYTFDYMSRQICPTVEEPSPKMSYPGLWEIPNVNLMHSDHSTCASMMDGCNPSGNASVWYEILLRNFHYHYDTNRMPLGVHMHLKYFYQGPAGDHLEAAQKFLKYAKGLGHVWILTASQVIDWMRNPQTIKKAKRFPTSGTVHLVHIRDGAVRPLTAVTLQSHETFT